ncbi:MAG: hypothetical protein U5K77_02740 [Candidatus Saccharibacteria bacterium]|nr:hypothetical protein [Candidatus Saccharibacteria bacterium]
MIPALAAIAVVFIILLASETLWRNKKLRGLEQSRKLVHITVGSFIASWAFFMPLWHIQIIAALMLVVVLVSRTLKVFRGIHSVKRKTYGDLLYPISIGLVAALASSPWIFAAAILHMSVADGLAAVIGNKFGKGNSYKVFVETKSIIGTATCLVVSALIISWIILWSPAGFDVLMWPAILWVPVLVAAVENLSPYGTDNLTVPIIVVLSLSSLL